LENYDSIMKVMLPTLGEERQATYSPFLPVCPRTGEVLQVPITETDPAKGLIRYVDPVRMKPLPRVLMAVRSNCNGNVIGRCGGMRLALIMR
jgi:lysyl-tRNA synthetase class I